MPIQRGDQRQYSQNEINKSALGEFAQLANSALQASVSITQKANESNLANNQIDLSTKFLAKNNEINTKYQADPTNPEREIEVQEAFEELANSYEINPVCQGQWKLIKNDVYNRYKTHNAQWVEKQQTANVETNLKNGYEALVDEVSMLAANGSSVDDMRLIYANGIDGLRKMATARLGTVVTENFLKDADHDIMTTYISSLAQNNPLEAQRLLADESVRNDIGRAETLEKLEGYIEKSLLNQHKKIAVEELGASLRAMNSKEADDLINGKADITKVMKFVENNKNIPRKSKELILGIYDINSTKSEYVYDRSKDKIVKNTSAKQKDKNTVAFTPEYKKFYAESLENKLHDLLAFSLDEENIPSAKDVNANEEGEKTQNDVIGYMKKVAELQGEIDVAYNAKAIEKQDRTRLMDTYITPVVDYLDNIAQEFDEGKLGQEKLGYTQIRKEFSTEGITDKEKIKQINKQKLFAQNYYLDELHKVVQDSKGAMTNIYDIEKLKPHQQREIYKIATENALNRAKRWTDNPEYFFAKDFPDTYSEPFKMFGQQEALEINKNVATAVYQTRFETDEKGDLANLKKFADSTMHTEILKKAKQNRIKAYGSLYQTELRDTLHAPEPSYNHQWLMNEIKKRGYTIEEFREKAEKDGYLQPLGSEYKGYMRLLRDLNHAETLKNQNKSS